MQLNLTTPVNNTINAELITLDMSIPLSPVNINNCCYDIHMFPEISIRDKEPRTRGSHADNIYSIRDVIGTFHPQYVGTIIHFRESMYNNGIDFNTPLKIPENTKDVEPFESHDYCSKVELLREPHSYFKPNTYHNDYDDYESSYKTMDPIFEMLFKPLDHPDFQPNPELEKFDAFLEKNAHVELEPYSELDPHSMIFNPDMYLENDFIESHKLLNCDCCYDANWEKKRERDFATIRVTMGKTYLEDGIMENYDCDCETCSTWNIEGLNNFNRNCSGEYVIKSIAEYEKLQLYSKNAQITLLDAVSNYMFWCNECETAVEINSHESNCNETICKIYDYTTDNDFNTQYNVNYSTEDIATTIEYAKERNLTINEAMNYLASCHFCGNNTRYGSEYCKPRCQDLAEDFNYECFRGKDCKVCNNYAICCAKLNISD